MTATETATEKVRYMYSTFLHNRYYKLRLQIVILALAARNFIWGSAISAVLTIIPWYGTIGLFQPIRSLADREIIANTIPRGMIFIINWVHFYRTYYGAPCIGMPPTPSRFDAMHLATGVLSIRTQRQNALHRTVRGWEHANAECTVGTVKVNGENLPPWLRPKPDSTHTNKQRTPITIQLNITTQRRLRSASVLIHSL